MPHYEYRCPKCGKKFEVEQRITEKPLEKCLYCDGHPKRLISNNVNIVFKGSGFHVTDYRSDSKANTAPAKPDKTEKSESHEKPAAPGKSESGDKSAAGDKSSATHKKPEKKDP
jgi:putative FmdB family regulatory protein